MDVSIYLRRELESRGWDPSELARRAGVTRQYVNGLLNGSTTSFRLDKARMIARALGVSMDDMAEELYGLDS